jgi:transcription antitermination factor NusG
MTERYWTVAQTVSKMEHIARREIEKTNHGAFLPTYARCQKVDGRDHVKECPIFTGYVFFLTDGDDWAGIPDIHGIYHVPANPNHRAQRVRDSEMFRMVLGHAGGEYNRTDPPRYTKYFRGERPKPQQAKRRRPRPRRSKMVRSAAPM